MKLLFLVLCFFISMLPIRDFINKKEALFLNKIYRKNYLIKNKRINTSNQGKILHIQENEKSETLHLYATYTPYRAIYTNNHGYFTGVVIIEKQLYQTLLSDSIFELDFNYLFIIGYQQDSYSDIFR